MMRWIRRQAVRLGLWRCRHPEATSKEWRRVVGGEDYLWSQFDCPDCGLHDSGFVMEQ